MKRLIKNYIFDSVNKTITITELATFKLENLLLITNVTKNIIIYSFADTLLSATKTGDSQITLKYNTTTMNDTDALQIFIDVPTEKIIEDEQYPLESALTYDTNLDKVLGTQPLTEDQRLKVNVGSNDKRVQGVLGAANQFLEINCNGMATCAIQTSGSWTGTIIIEGNVDSNGSAFYGLYLNNSAGAAPLSYSPGAIQNSNGLFRVSTVGLARLRVRFSSYTSGIATVVIVASVNSYVVPLNLVSGGQLNTSDSTLASLWRKGQTDQPTEQIFTPNVNPTMPSVYAETKFSKMPQIYARLRAEIGGSERLPFTQEANTNNLVVTNNDGRRLLEEILIQIKLLNQNFSLVNNIKIPNSEEIN